ncbi:MAG: hypothetical protein ACTIL3_08845, partial [Brevibacterium aurantiacum]
IRLGRGWNPRQGRVYDSFYVIAQSVPRLGAAAVSSSCSVATITRVATITEETWVPMSVHG